MQHRLTAFLILPLLMLGLIGCNFSNEGESSSNPPIFAEGMTLDQKISQTREHLFLPGAVVAVHESDKVLIDKAYGVASLETNAALTKGHHFRIASMTKPFLAVVMLQLAEEGKLKIDNPVSKYLDGVPAGDKITLRMLAQHTSGLMNYIAQPHVKEAFANEPQRAWKKEELLKFAFDAGAYFDPEEGGFMYSNTNYILLQQVLEKVEGKPINDSIQARICKPLQMKNTFYSTDPKMPEPFASGYQYGDENGPIFWKGIGNIPYDQTYASPTMWHGAGAMVSTLGDMTTFIKDICDPNSKLLKEDSQREVFAWHDTGYPVPYWYGLGLMKYHDGIGHSGYIPGYQCTMMHDPTADRTVVILTNCYSSPNWEGPANALYYVIHRHLTGESIAPPGWDGW
ncbi:MAG: serine hydrolase domain-containing protein [Planctomycetota bacterium]